MAINILGDRHIVATDISLVCNDVVTKGTVLGYGTSGSGVALGDNAGVAAFYANQSGHVPVGPTLANFVNIDQTRQHRNFHNNEQVVGEKAPILRDGWIITNGIIGAAPNPGNTAYWEGSGMVTATLSATGGLKCTPKVGEFMSMLDENGYAKVYFKLPQPQ